MKPLRAASVLLLLPLAGCIAVFDTGGGSGLEKRIHRLEKRIEGLEEQGKGSGQVHRLPDGTVIIRDSSVEVRSEMDVVPENPK